MSEKISLDSSVVEIFFQENPQKPQHIYFHSIDEWNSYLRLDVYILLYQTLLSKEITP